MSLHRIMGLAAALGVSFFLAACGGGGGEPTGCPAGRVPAPGGACVEPCELLECRNGSCDDSSGVATCVCVTGHVGASCEACDSGFQDHDGDGLCFPDCETSALECLRGSCDDSSGRAVCACPPGYGGPLCGSCALGFQDNDGDGLCLPGCNTADLLCGAWGRCIDESGVATCVCRPGHEGPGCADCVEGFQDHDGDGLCMPGCGTAAVDCLQGSCDDSTGLAVCACEPGHAGPSCERCAAGYQDHDRDGSCLVACGPLGPVCEQGVCRDSSGSAGCVCFEGYTGPLCDRCADGFRMSDEGLCLPSCLPTSCGVGGTCDDSGGSPVCTCEPGYVGQRCEGCDAGYQDHDMDGSCLESCSPTTCEAGRLCNDASGTALCVSPPASCRDIQRVSAFPRDGAQTLYVGGNLARPWKAWCADMEEDPLEYLDLPRASASKGDYVLENFAGWLQTTYRRPRIDPVTLRMKVDDHRFSTQWAENMSGFTALGTAISCEPSFEAEGGIDTRGSRFRVVDTTFCIVGEEATGRVVPESDGWRLLIFGSATQGHCGGIVPSLDPACVFPSNSDGWDIQLTYVPCPEGTSGPDCE